MKRVLYVRAKQSSRDYLASLSTQQGDISRFVRAAFGADHDPKRLEFFISLDEPTIPMAAQIDDDLSLRVENAARKFSCSAKKIGGAMVDCYVEFLKANPGYKPIEPKPVRQPRTVNLVDIQPETGYSPALHQAITLAALLIEFEMENPQVTPIPPDWQADLRQARTELKRLHRTLEQYRPKTVFRKPRIIRPKKRNGDTPRFESAEKIRQELRGEI